MIGSGARASWARQGHGATPPRARRAGRLARALRFEQRCDRGTGAAPRGAWRRETEVLGEVARLHDGQAARDRDPCRKVFVPRGADRSIRGRRRRRRGCGPRRSHPRRRLDVGVERLLPQRRERDGWSWGDEPWARRPRRRHRTGRGRDRRHHRAGGESRRRHHLRSVTTRRRFVTVRRRPLSSARTASAVERRTRWSFSSTTGRAVAR